MKRPRAVLPSVGALVAVLLPLLSVSGHLDRDFGSLLEEREVFVTGHEERDATLHVEAASGVVHERCPECVLEKRRFGAGEHVGPRLALRPSGPHAAQKELPGGGPDVSESGPARAPPLV